MKSISAVALSLSSALIAPLNAFEIDDPRASFLKSQIQERSSKFYDQKLEKIRRGSLPYPNSGISEGDGWSSIRSSPTLTNCIHFEIDTGGGQRAEVHAERIMDSNSLRKEIGVTAEMQAKADFGIGGGGASYKTSFVKSSSVSNSSINLLYKVNVVNGRTFVKPADYFENKETGEIIATPGFILKPAAAEHLGFDPFSTNVTSEQLEQFAQYCGDSFVSSIETGAEAYALYEVSESKARDKKDSETEAGVEVNYASFGGSASLKSSELVEKIRTNKVKNINYFHASHRGVLLPYNEDSIYSSIEYIGAASEISEAFPIHFYVTRYDELPNWKSPKIEQELLFKESLYAYYSRLQDLKYILVDIRHNPEKYFNLKLDRSAKKPEENRIKEVAIYPKDYIRLEKIIDARLVFVGKEIKTCLERKQSDLISLNSLVKVCSP